MIRVVGNSIRIPRGDTGTLQFQIFTARRTPYILPQGLTAPVIVCAVARKTDSLELSDGLLIKKLFALPLNNMPALEPEILPYSETHDTEHVYAKADGTYCYFTGTTGNLTEHVYNFIISVPFEPADTASMAAGSYRVNMFIVDASGKSYIDWEEDTDAAIAGITYKETLLETREFVVEPSTYPVLEPLGWQYLNCDPIGQYLQENNYPYIVVSGALPLTVFYKPVSIVSVEKTGTSGLVDTYTITYSDGTTSTFTVTNGQDGNIVQVTEESVPLIPGSIHIEELESNHLYSFSGVAHDVTIDITLDFETGSFAEVTFIAGQNIANNGITINNAQGNVPVVIVEYGVSMQVSEWRPEYGKQVSLLFCNNGLSIVCGVTEV